MIRTVEDILNDDKTAKLDPIKNLWADSDNYDYPSPLTFFLDIVGYTYEEFGATLTSIDEMKDKLGYHEIGALGEALVAYSDRPNESFELIKELIKAELEEQN